MRNALETWRSEERPEIGRKQFSKVILSGGGAHLAGLDASLARAFACPAEVLGAADGPGRPPEPRLLTAYGLALHGLGLSQAGISLSTQRVRVQRHRRARFPFLAAAAALLVIFAGLLEVSAYRNLTERQATVNRELEHLRNCNRIVPDLEASQQDIEFHQRVLIPFVEKGNHAQRFLRSVAKLQRAKERMLGESGHPEGWVIYVADERSFHAGKPKADGAGAGRGAGSGFDPFSGAATAGGGVTAAAGDPFPNRVVVTDLEPVRSMVAAVYTTHDAKEPYRLIKSLVAALNPPDPAATPPGKENPPADPDADLLAGVDLMPESESAGREDVFLPWVEYFKRHEPSDKPAGFRRFVLRLPFASVDIQEPPAAGGAPK
ncbi:MAG: hypothetical protein BWZ02_03181 [Lentisphaerae bacterium ADurb.BinA184]|nr:MAG: hypothetical protein BWZ02_03181 [Lentisphaerae bacterium ADurb.BinA184]